MQTSQTTGYDSFIGGYESVLQATTRRCIEEQYCADAEADRARQWMALGRPAHAIASQETSAYHAAEARVRLDRIRPFVMRNHIHIIAAAAVFAGGFVLAVANTQPSASQLITDAFHQVSLAPAHGSICMPMSRNVEDRRDAIAVLIENN